MRFCWEQHRSGQLSSVANACVHVPVCVCKRVCVCTCTCVCTARVCTAVGLQPPPPVLLPSLLLLLPSRESTPQDE